MKLVSLHLEDVRGFERVDLDFHERLTVIVGINGAGKTTLLDATASLLSTLRDSQGGSWLFHEQARRNGSASPSRGTLDVATPTGDIRANVEEGRHFLTSQGQYREYLSEDPTVFAYYKNSPDVVTTSVMDAAPHPDDRARPWLSKLHGNTSVKTFFNWFREREEEENFQRSRRGDLSYWDPQLKTIREAVSRLLPGTSDLHIERSPVRMVVQKGGQMLGVGDLSEGEKRLLAICGDLATRLSLTHPGSITPLEQPGIVLLDEIELHLHPSWQRVVLERLQQTFPGCQFVVTTHSPTVLAGVEPGSLRLLRDFTVSAYEGHTRGRSADALLREVMGVPERPDDAAARIHEVAVLIDEERFDEARHKLGQLASWLGQEDEEIVRLGTLISFLEGEHAVVPEGA